MPEAFDDEAQGILENLGTGFDTHFKKSKNGSPLLMIKPNSTDLNYFVHNDVDTGLLVQTAFFAHNKEITKKNIETIETTLPDILNSIYRALDEVPQITNPIRFEFTLC